VRAFPSPVRTHASIPLQLDRPQRLTLAVFDAAGRCVATILTDAPLPAGTHVVPLPVATLPRGFLLLRLRAGGNISVEKMLVNR
jgi:hypothetical protein